MNPVIVTYLGFVVALLVLSWGAFEIISRYRRGNGGRRKQKMPAQQLQTWVPLKPTGVDVMSDPLSDMRETPAESVDHELHTRAQQNGHFSESKKNL